MKKIVSALAITAGFMSIAAPAGAVTKDKIVGSVNAAAAINYRQNGGTCEEGAVNIVYGLDKGSRMHEATIVKEATKLGVYDGSGSNWYGSNGIVELMSHYGIKSTIGSHTIQTIEADLKAGDHVIALVNEATILNSAFPGQWADADDPSGESFQSYDFVEADHALVLDQVDITTSVATVSDTGTGMTYTVPLAVFRAAVATGGYQYDISSKNGK